MEKGDGFGHGRGEQQSRQVFDGVSYRLLGFDIPFEQLYKSEIEIRGGKAASRLAKETCTHLIVNSDRIEYNERFCKKAREDEIIVVNQHWVEDSVLGGALADPEKVLYRPVKELDGISGSLRLHICTAGYSEHMCTMLRTMTDLMGATFYEKWEDKVTHLICYKFEGDDYSRAKKRKTHVVNERWLEECLKQWRIVPVDSYNISGWELEQQQAHAKGTSQALVFHEPVPSTIELPADKQFSRMKRDYSMKENRERNANNSSPEMKKSCISSQYHTPSSNTCLVQTSRRAFSTGAKKVKDHPECVSTLKCKRSLDYISSGRNKKMTLHDYAKCGLIQHVQIPYSTSTQKIAKDRIKLILLNAYEEVMDLHQESKSLKGPLNPKNFLISLNSKKVSLQDVEVQPYLKGDGAADKAKFVVMTKAMFGDSIPADITGWLDSITEGAPYSVLRRHVNMLHASNAFGDFCIMFHSLLKLKANDKVRYNALLDSLSSYEDWQHKKFNWSILEDNFKYCDPNAKGSESSYDENVFGLCKLIRNCWQHPAKLYHEYLMAILLGEYPKLLSDLQKALYEAGYLRHLDVKN